MAWVAVAILAVIAALFMMLYQRALKEGRYVRALLIQVLLDKDTYEFQQDGLRKLVSSMEAKDALDLSSKVQLSVSHLALRLGGQTLLASHALLWQFKRQTNA